MASDYQIVALKSFVMLQSIRVCGTCVRVRECAGVCGSVRECAGVRMHINRRTTNTALS